MDSDVRETIISTDVCVLGAGVCGIVTAKCLQDVGLDVLVLEMSGDIGGLWTFREHSHGVMRSTHINVSKYNYCFSDYPFPDTSRDFPHHSEMCQYIRGYVNKNKLMDLIQLHRSVKHLTKKDNGWLIEVDVVKEEDNGCLVTVGVETYQSKFVAIATGHHVSPRIITLPGQETFSGTVTHSVEYKDPAFNKLEESSTLVVGIGNSSIDIAVDLATTGRCKKVYISTRSGAWIWPTYLFGLPIDLYACRYNLNTPWWINTRLVETILTVLMGHPNRWGLNPKMRILQTQATVNSTLIHLIQRGCINIKPGLSQVNGSVVQFTDGSCCDVDNIILATGYKIDLSFLDPQIVDKVWNREGNLVHLWKSVFSPVLGPTLAFIGFVQPSSGGVIAMAETQARWFAEMCINGGELAPIQTMEADILSEKEKCKSRYYPSVRHTIQQDPLLYCDDIASRFNAKPTVWKHPTLAFRLMLGSGGAAQWRLSGPGAWDGAYQQVLKVPIPGFMKIYMATFLVTTCLTLYLIYWLVF